MPDTGYAIEVSNEILTEEGIFFCNDYVGPLRFQWSDIELALINGVRTMLDESVFKKDGGDSYRRRYKRPSLEHMFTTDPSEAADSANIISSIKAVFNEPLIINTGGLIYHITINYILHNIPEDSELLQWLLSMDDEIIKLGFYHYAFALAHKL